MDTFRRGALTFPVRDSGPDGGSPIILLHGFPQDESAFDEVTPSLVGLGLRTLVPTQRGYAATNRPTGRHDYRLRELVDDVLALADAAGAERFHLVGHDWGGGVAWAVTAWHPDRVTSLTVLSTPHPNALRWSLLHSDQALKSWYMAFFQLPAVPEWVLSHALERSLTASGLPQPVAKRYASGPVGRLTAESGQMRARMLALAIGRVAVDDRRRRLPAIGPLVAQIDP